MNKNMFIKCMNLTASENDGESLNALRAANRFLQKYDLRWEQVIRWPAEIYEDEDLRIETMLDVCLVKVRGRASSFIVSLMDSFEEYGQLTEKQLAALEKFYESVRDK